MDMVIRDNDDSVRTRLRNTPPHILEGGEDGVAVFCRYRIGEVQHHWRMTCRVNSYQLSHVVFLLPQPSEMLRNPVRKSVAPDSEREAGRDWLRPDTSHRYRCRAQLRGGYQPSEPRKGIHPATRGNA